MDYLTIPLRQRAAKRAKDTVGNFASHPAAVGGIWTREGDGSRFTPHPGMRGLGAWVIEDEGIGRFVGAADTVISVRHKGWFVDHCQDHTTRGVVYRLPHGRFLAGASDPWQSAKDGSGPFLCRPSVHDSAEDAARAADRVAERYAESCREDDAREQAEFQIEHARESIATLREEIRCLVRDIRLSILAPAVCANLRQSIRRMRADTSRQWRRVKQLQANYWAAVENA